MARDELIDVSTDKYLLPRSPEEARRLDSQHDVLVHATRLLFHPALGNLSQFRSILDCGTGTTVWLRDLLAGGVPASSLGKGNVHLSDDCVLEGCDYSSLQVPTPLPNGIADFFLQDVLEAFPQDKQPRYDLVHQRFLSGGIPACLWPQALGNLKGALKPGCYLILHEAGFPLMAAGQPQTGSCNFIEQYSALSEKLCALAGINSRLHEDLGDMMLDIGFVDVEVIQYLLPFGAAAPDDLDQAYIAASLAIAPTTLAFTGPLPCAVDPYQGTEGVPSHGEAEEILDGMLRELETRGGLLPCAMLVGRKPSPEDVG